MNELFYGEVSISRCFLKDLKNARERVWQSEECDTTLS